MSRRKNHTKNRIETPTVGELSHSQDRSLESYRVGSLPIIQMILDRLQLGESLRSHLPKEDRRTKIPTDVSLIILLKNFLISREPLYGIGEWAGKYAPELLSIQACQISHLNDDRVGRALDRLFDSDCSSLALEVAGRAVEEFAVELEELHNDSTTVTFHGDYETAERESVLRGSKRLAITFGHNKDHRPDLKQLLYILTISKDGGVPVYFQVDNGNVSDDKTHRSTWDLLRRLTGVNDFLYVADCKLATSENMSYIHNNGGRFLTVLPRTRHEDRIFRSNLMSGKINWKHIYDKIDCETDKIIDRYSIDVRPSISVEGYRLIWFHSTRKAELDAVSRANRIDRALNDLAELRRKLNSPRTRYRLRANVAEAVEDILSKRSVSGLIKVSILEYSEDGFRQESPGRPNHNTKYIKKSRIRFDLEYHLEHGKIEEESRCDGVFPLITNDRAMTEFDLLIAYKGQPIIEKRFSQLKTDFNVAPVYLKEASRIQGLLCIYFLALLVESLLEREMRLAMLRDGVESLPIYPENRPCRRPTTRRMIDIFDDVRIHTLVGPKEPRIVFKTELTGSQRRIVDMLGIKHPYYQI